jgi:hypothetical protein
MIYEEDIEKEGVEFEAELSKGREVARNNGINLTKFKIEILKTMKINGHLTMKVI